MSNKSLKQAKAVKYDEFYTQYADVVKTLSKYKEYFNHKVVYCNCDNPVISAFWRYFHVNFSTIGIKKLIATYYTQETAYNCEYTGGCDDDIKVYSKTPLQGNGDFRDTECVEILKSVDIVITNPPFSLYRELIRLLYNNSKKFILVTPLTALCYKDVFPYIKTNEFFVDDEIKHFDVTKEYAEYLIKNRPSGYRVINGEIKAKVTCVWLTNLYIQNQFCVDKIGSTIYTPDKFERYDNFDAINIDKLSDIPCDYNGVMGVPITYLQVHTPLLFEILGLISKYDLPDIEKYRTKIYINPLHIKENTKVKAANIITSPMIRCDDTAKEYYTADNLDYKLRMCYNRVLIRRKIN